MSVPEINAVKDAVIEVIGYIACLAFCLLFVLAMCGAFDKDRK